MKRSGSITFFMELTMILLFFALSATVILRLFSTAYINETESNLISDASIGIQTINEMFDADGMKIFEADNWIEIEDKDLAACCVMFIKTTETNSGEKILYQVEIDKNAKTYLGGAYLSGRTSAYKINAKTEFYENGIPKGKPLCSAAVAKYEQEAAR